MNYIVFDLEFNQLYTKKKSQNAILSADSEENKSDIAENKSIEKTTEKNNISVSLNDGVHYKNPSLEMPFEIIQIGAVKLDDNFEIIDTFSKLVKPSLYKEIHPFICELTSITTDMVEDEELFPKVYGDFMKFIGNDDFIMCVWGIDDIKQLLRNIKFHGLNVHNNFKKYIDIQVLASKKFNTPKGNRLGLKTAVEFWNIPIENDFHDALNDAVYTAQVFRKVYTKDVKVCTYSPPNYPRESRPSLKVDTEKLIAQFEKMFARKMTKEEKSIIRIAYNMGKTHQFLK
ncbi:3'-5' exonuclease [uncultured Clostridium sp.]|uniref:3'-5' exonuclease n=1 Tax=uncultured Clostridium sp. TaxID=59620 RepID=UPI0025E04631|nr:3'-5' exonuclease [uncultured Clostridium sp.]